MLATRETLVASSYMAKLYNTTFVIMHYKQPIIGISDPKYVNLSNKSKYRGKVRQDTDHCDKYSTVPRLC